MTAPYVTIPPTTGNHMGGPASSFTWTMGAISHYSSQILIGTEAGYNDVYAGKEIVGNGPTITDNSVPTPGGQAYLHTKIQYRQTKGGIWRNGGSLTTFTCI